MKSIALLFTLFGACAGSALAQGAAGMYGVLDAGMVGQSGCAGCAPRLDSGVASESRLGVRGSELLDDGLTALFALEAGVALDTGRADQGARLFGRQAFVGLQGKAGLLTFGRQLDLDYLALTDVGDPFKGGMAGSATNLVGNSGRRDDNSIHYVSGERHGVSAAASYEVGELVRDGANNRAWGVSIGLRRGPLNLRVAQQNRSMAPVAPVAPVAPASAMGNSVDARNTIVAANLEFGKGTAYAAYSANRGWGSSPLWNPDNPYGAALASTPSTDSRDVLVGLALPFGATTVLASYIRKDDRGLANRDASQIAIGATYAVSRRTDFYAACSHITNRNGAGYTVGNASAPGSGSAALNLGMRHAF